MPSTSSLSPSEVEKYLSLGKSRSMCLPANVDALVQLVNKGIGAIVEVGSYKCGASIAMAAVTHKQVFAFDLFGGLPYTDRGFENFADADYEEILSVTQHLSNLLFIRGRHEETIPRFFRIPIIVGLLFLDSDHYESHRVTLKNVWPLISSGGSVVFHDWKFRDVQQAIQISIDPEDCSYFGTLPPPSDNMGMITKK